MQTIQEYLNEGFNGKAPKYNEMLKILEKNKNFRPVEDLEAHGNWKTEDGEYNFHAVDDSYKFFIFTQQNGGGLNMENRYMYGPDAYHSNKKVIMVSGEFPGTVPNVITVVMMHFGQNGVCDYFTAEKLYGNGEFGGYPTHNTKNFNDLENILSSIGVEK